MENPKELYHEEIKNLNVFRKRLENNSVEKIHLIEFADQYEELMTQSTIITKVSDRLQKKLDTANLQISEQNIEIRSKNDTLESTISELTKAQMGRKASTIMLFAALSLFILEQYFLQPIIEENIPFEFDYLSIFVLIGLFFFVKYLESALQKYFMKQEQKRILNMKKSKDS